MDAQIETSRPDAQHGSALSRAWRAYVPIGMFLAVYLVGVAVAIVPLGREVIIFDWLYVPVYSVSFGVFVLAVGLRGFWTKIVARGDVPMRVRLKDIATGTPWAEMIFLRFLPALIFIFALMRLFLSFKPAIPELLPFIWDEVFRDLDRALFLGHDGWQVTHWLVPWDWGAVVIDRIYVLWFPGVVLTIFMAAMAPLTSKVRLAYFMTFALNWIIGGSVLAVVFSSAGPVFYDRVLGDDGFVPMLYRLTEASQLSALATLQGVEFLWDGYLKLPGVAQYGISAFPSLHVAMTTLVYIYVRQLSRFWGWVTLLFLFVIVFGSVHLGWHYLVDGIAGVMLSWTHWTLSMRFTHWWLRPAQA